MGTTQGSVGLCRGVNLADIVVLRKCMLCCLGLHFNVLVEALRYTQSFVI